MRCSECEQIEKTQETNDQIQQGGCAKCEAASLTYEAERCKTCILTATADNKFPNFKRHKIWLPK